MLCKACGLYLNQLPVFDNQNKSNVFWVGLSSVLISDEIERQPLSPFTRSGALLKEIENTYTEDIYFYRTNVVKCLPLQKNKIRYPLKHEMEKCFPNLEREINLLKPSIVFLLGKQVSTFVLKKLSFECPDFDRNFKYDSFTNEDIIYIPIHHPSYILVYKRKSIQSYIKGIECFLLNSIVHTPTHILD